jgi:acyl-CoA synthetase (NDP forming)
MSGRSQAARGAAAVENFVRPKSVAIIGLSSKPGSAGMNALANLTNNNFAGDIYLVGRSGGEVNGRKVFTEIDELPEGVDLAIFTLPVVGVKDALEGCVRRKVKAVVCFASGFAEIGEREKQDEIAKIASDGGVALLGPNCLGYTNIVDGFSAGFVNANTIVKPPPSNDPKTAILSQSGGMMAHIKSGLELRDLPVSYMISTGNEAGVGLPDFVDFFTSDPNTQMIVVYVEEVRDPEGFKKAAHRAREAGKPVIMMHPGRTAAAVQAVSSHTGALAGDHAVMRTLVEHAGICFVDNVDEMVDTAEVLARFPNPIAAGPGILTFSGAFCAIAHDFCGEIGLPVPPLSAEGEKILRAALPGFATPRNPLDLTTQPVWQPDLMYTGAKALLDDPKIGSLMISIPPSGPMLKTYLEHVIRALKECPVKPVIFGVLGDRLQLPQDFLDLAREKRIIISRSADRSLRALLAVYKHGAALERAKKTVPQKAIASLPPLGKGTQAEWVGKKVLAAAGVKIPPGDLARTADEAAAIAKRIGFPVAMKAQAAKLAHKTEAGGVLLNIADEAGVREAFQKLHDNVKKYNASIVLDGALVETMSKRGLEMVVGAKRDPKWGPVIVAGVGGVMIEVIGDVRLMPPDLSAEAIAEELGKLKMAKMLSGFRGAPAVDVKALAEVAAAIGQIMRATPEIIEIDINPLVAHAAGEGVTALDALIVTQD